MSAPPPGASGIMNLTGRAGNSCADAAAAPNALASSKTAVAFLELHAKRGVILHPSSFIPGPKSLVPGLLQPFFRLSRLSRGKAANVRRDEMAREAGRELTDARVRDERDPADLPVMAAHEAEVLEHAGEILPSRKPLDLDHQAGQRALLGDIRIRQPGEQLEVALLQRPGRPDMEDARRLVQLSGDNLAPLLRYSSIEQYFQD